MTDYHATKLERKYKSLGLKIMDSAEGLRYAVDNERAGIAVISDFGMIGLTAKQARRLTAELPDVIATFIDTY